MMSTGTLYWKKKIEQNIWLIVKLQSHSKCNGTTSRERSQPT